MKSVYVSQMVCNHIWKDFLAHFKSETTRASYASDLDQLMNHFEKDFLKINPRDVEQYYHFLQKQVDQGRLKSATMAKKFREFHSFANFICENREHYGISLAFQDGFEPYLKKLAKQEKYTKSIPIEHMDRLLEAAMENQMAYTILTLLYRVGLSSTEIISLKKENFVAYDNGVYVTIEGRREASFVPKDVFVIVEQYLQGQEKRGKLEEQDNLLFVNGRGNALNLMYISRMMKKYTSKAGVPSYSAESVRNTCGVNLFSYGASPEQVAAQMGVTQMQIQRYHNVSYKEQMLRSANELVRVKVLPPQNRK